MNSYRKSNHLLFCRREIGLALLVVSLILSASSESRAQPPQVAAVSAASYDPNSPLASDSIGALFGANMAGGVAFAGTHPLPLQLASVSVNIRDASFGKNYGVLIAGGALDRIHARAVFVIGADDKVKHVEYVKEIAEQPNYEAALAAAQ